MYIRKKITDGREYYYLVDGKRDKEGKVKQKVIAYIGNKEKLKELYKKIGEKIRNENNFLKTKILKTPNHNK